MKDAGIVIITFTKVKENLGKIACPRTSLMLSSLVPNGFPLSLLHSRKDIEVPWNEVGVCFSKCAFYTNVL